MAVDLALGAWLLATRQRRSSCAARPPSLPPPSRRERVRRPVGAAVGARSAAFACGFAILALQVVWLRIFRIYLTNTSYTFALIASLAILGLYRGQRAVPPARRAPRRPARSPLLRALLLLAATAPLGLLLLVRLPRALMFPFAGGRRAAPFVRILLLPLVASLLIVVPPAVVLRLRLPAGLQPGGLRRGDSRR